MTAVTPMVGQGLAFPSRKLDSQQGLSQSTNFFVYKDSRGFIWVSSLDGLNRFNGREVSVFRPKMNDPHSMMGVNIQSPFFEDSLGNIWFTTERALNCYRTRRGDFDHYVLPTAPQGNESILHSAFFLERSRWLWVAAGDSLYRFDTKATTQRTNVQRLHQFGAMRCSVILSPEGWVRQLYGCYWDIGHGFEVITYNSKAQITKRDTFFAKEGSPASFELICKQSVVENDTLIWLATNQGLLSFRINDPKGYQIYFPKGRKKGIRYLFQQSEGLLWIASDDGAIIPFDTKKRTFGSPLSDENGQEISGADVILFDKDSTLWYSINGEGLFFLKYIKKKFEQPLKISTREKISISNIFQNNDGAIYCTDQLGSTYIYDKSMNYINTIRLPAYSKMYMDESAKIWNISALGLGEFNVLKNDVDVSFPAVGRAFYDIVDNHKGSLFLGNSGGLIEVSANGVNKPRQVEELPEGAVALCIDRLGQFWIGTSEYLSVWEINATSKYSLKKIYKNTGIVNHIIEDPFSNNIWVGSAFGLIKIDLKTCRDTLINEDVGLPNQYVYAVVPDRKGNIWLSTNKGITKYMPYMPIGQQFKQYSTHHGLSSNEFCRGSALLSKMGDIWFGSTKGVDVFNPDLMDNIGSAPQLAITDLKIHDQKWHNDSVAIEMANQITLKYNENTLRLELAAMEYTDPEMNKFRVWLSRDDNKPDTVELGTQNFITYANLRPGHYRFGFTACNSEGIWQETPRNLDIFIRPHFTQTWWFPWLVGLLALAVIGFGTAFYYRYRLRLQQLALEKQQREAERKQLLLENELALQEERNRIADEMHDELGGGLSTIRLASQRAKKVQSSEELQTILKRVSQISIGLVNNMRGIIWAMDSQNDSLRSLMAYIRQYAGTFLDDNGIAASLSLPGDFPDRALSSQFRHNIMLTVKECLNNILKHADATEVVLSSSVNGQLQITIRDNGKGFDPIEQSGMGKGLRTTVKRMESVGGSIAWQRNNEGGMTVTLLAPLP